MKQVLGYFLGFAIFIVGIPYPFKILKDQFHIVAAGIDGFLLGKESAFTSVDDQADKE